MAYLKVLGSGSGGNGYILECEGESLVIELGLPFKNYILATDLSSVAGAIVSHRHKDHFLENTAERFLKAGIPVLANADTIYTYTKKDPLCALMTVEPNRYYPLGGFTVQPIVLEHSARNFGYIVKHKEFGKLVFATDTKHFKYKVKGVNHWMLECNYDSNIVIDTKLASEEVRSHYNDHLSVQQCADALKANVEEGVTRTITLIHLSDANSNAAAMLSSVREATGLEGVYVADERQKNQTINLQ